MPPGITRRSRLTLDNYCPESATSSRNPISFLGKRYLETSLWTKDLFKLIKLSSNTLTINYLLYQLLLKHQITYKRKKHCQDAAVKKDPWEGESGWGIHVNPWLIHVNVCQKPLQYCKVISLQLIKINRKKRSPSMPKGFTSKHKEVPTDQREII